MESVPKTPRRRRRSVTIRDVAREAAVGAGTVSRVLNWPETVSDETRARVESVIKDLDYRPSQIARNLSLGRTMTIAVVAPFLTRPSVVERLRGFTRAIDGSGYDVVLFDVESRYQRDAQLRKLAQRGQADGAIVTSLPLTDAEVAGFWHVGVRLVLLDTAHAELPSVAIDDVEGGVLATQHLLELGHRRIAFVGDVEVNPFGFTSSNDRRAGYRIALEHAGLPWRPEYVGEAEHGEDAAVRLTDALLQLPEPPTAVFAASDTQAIGVLDAARRAGARVPEDLSVIGFDDIEVARYLGLTTVRQPLDESGARAAELLLAALRDELPPATAAKLELSIVQRETTARVAG